MTDSQSHGDFEPPIDPEVDRLRREAETLEEELEGARRDAEASIVGSPERARFRKLNDQGEAAWRALHERVRELQGLTDDPG